MKCVKVNQHELLWAMRSGFEESTLQAIGYEIPVEMIPLLSLQFQMFSNINEDCKSRSSFRENLEHSMIIWTAK